MDSGTSVLIFKNALHAPELASNLISINKFDKASFRIVFSGGKVHFYDPSGREVLRGIGTGGMYLLGTLNKVNTPSARMARSQSHPVPLEV